MLTALLSLGRVAAYCFAEAGHDPVKCVRPELSERGGLCGAPLQGSLSINSRVPGNGRSDLYPDLIQLQMDT